MALPVPMPTFWTSQAADMQAELPSHGDAAQFKGEVPAVTLLVNSSDGFDDCWPPFFTLLQHYWPEMTWPVLLNTETRDFSWPALNVTASCVARGETQRLSWSECLIRATEAVKTPLLLYVQEDYFLDQPVDDATVRAAVQLMLNHPEIGHIGLTKHGSHGPFAPSQHDGFGIIGKRARYRISTQAGLWRPSVLRSYLRPEENGWMFEIFGTWRAHRDNVTFLTVMCDPPRKPAPVDYVHTGIIKGQWHEKIPTLFGRHNLPLDFDRRGIYQPASALLHKWGVGRKLMQQPSYALRQIVNRFLGW
jgi:hypothetical protein